MQELQEFAVSDERRTYEHEWSAGDVGFPLCSTRSLRSNLTSTDCFQVVMWDNRCTLHRAMPYPHTHERTLWHVRIQGERESEAAVNMNELVNVAQASL